LRGRTVTAGLAIPFGPFLVVGLLGVLGARLI
ncbi:MAG: prepilin peptidase, partial [Caulobacteraceae bacterium]|nr:prepilin peptidase [Caulobacter sp.]